MNDVYAPESIRHSIYSSLTWTLLAVAHFVFLILKLKIISFFNFSFVFFILIARFLFSCVKTIFSLFTISRDFNLFSEACLSISSEFTRLTVVCNPWLCALSFCTFHRIKIFVYFYNFHSSGY